MLNLLKKNKILFIMVMISFIAFFLGFIYHHNLNQSDRLIVDNNIHLFFDNESITSSFFYNHLISNFIIWIFGISIVGGIIAFILFFIKVFVYSFELFSLISTLGMKSIFSILIYYLPNTIMLFISFLITYYASLLSLYLFRFLFFKEKFFFNIIIKKYFAFLLMFITSLILSSFIHYFIIKYLINF